MKQWFFGIDKLTGITTVTISQEEAEARFNPGFLHLVEKSEYDKLTHEIESLCRSLEVMEYRVNHVHHNTECIGMMLCHVDGNCLHCLTAPTRVEKK